METMRGVNFLLLAFVVLAIAALPQCLSLENDRRLFATTSVKKERSVDLKKGIHPRRSARVPDRYSQETTTEDFTADMPGTFNNPQFVKDRRVYVIGGPRRLQSIAEEEGFVAKEWPVQFTISFTTKYGAATGFLAYDWLQQRQVVYHGPNSTFCQSHGTDDACLMLEVTSGTYVYIPSEDKCTLAVKGVGSLPPNWTVQSSFIGVELIPDVGPCRTFAFPPSSHIWGETVDGGLPCVFIFADPFSTYYFDPQTLQLGAPNEKLFDFPDFCFGSSGFVESL